MDFALDYYALNLRFKRSEGESAVRVTDRHDVDELDERRRGACFSGTTTTIASFIGRYVLKYCLTPGRATET